MKKFYTLEQIADCLVVSTRTAQIGDKGPGRIGALVSHQKLSALRCPRRRCSRAQDNRKSEWGVSDLAGGVVRPDRNGLAHGKPPQFAILNHAAIDSGKS
jgi:hypothetical protein